ncbi:MAG: undecaprenyl-phosphate glucose phosphotransferase [Oribacterium sp.]|nr:undecaprenyl-phosphate glucose phosphotransferase [Oribacterium sp.]MDY6308424.1 undecaprenyl-phosphate glucose phosphotransferase [Oribacterium sp.]MDY6317546.1 undecaprenyl-phosphate glucose phosphotransferase [Oribacterium sp.]
MIKNNQHLLNQFHVVLDALIIAGAWALAWYLMIGSRIFPAGYGVLPPRIYFSALIPIIPVYLILYWAFGLYQPKRTRTKRTEFFNICKANTIGLMLFTSILYLLRRSGYFAHFSTRMIAVFYLLNIAACGIERGGIRFILTRMRKQGFNQKHIVLVGFSDVSDMFIDACHRNPDWGYHIYGIVDDIVQDGATYKGVNVIGRISDLEQILAKNTIDEIAITLPLAAYEKLAGIVAVCEKSGVHTKFIPDYTNIISSKPSTEDMDGLPVINIRNVPLTDPVNASMKRLVDIFGSLFGIVLFSPVMLVTAVAIKLSSPGPVIFKQERVGLHNKPFMMYKFRSMVQQKPEDEKKGWTTKGDPRVTRVGRFIRKTSIDELPQFFNVLLGTMSLVGPRPERTQFVEMFKEEIPRYMIKHQVRPGMTGWAQVNGLRGDTSIYERVRYDIWYIENWSMALDFKILFMTIFKGFVNKNAY